MQPTKVKSFTLSELLVVMIITVIVVGITFGVLSLVQKQIRTIEKNFQKTTELSLLEQQLWQDFYQHNKVLYSEEKLIMISDIDTIEYTFKSGYSLRNKDTIALKLTPAKTYYMGTEIKSGYIDAISISADQEIPDYSIFVTAKKDAAHFINKNGI